MQIVYISNSIIPSRTANSIQVMRMCEAFANLGHELILLAPHQPSEYEKGVEDLWNFYGVKQNFEIKKLWYPGFKGKNQIYGFLAGYETNKENPDLVYGRSIDGLWWASKFGYEPIVELHQPASPGPPLGKTVHRWIFKRMISSGILKRVVVISKALRDKIKGSLKDQQVLVAHDAAKEKDLNKSKPNEYYEEPVKVGYVGHLYKGKGGEMILEIAEENPELEFHIYGGVKEDVKVIRGKSCENVKVHGFVAPGATGEKYKKLDILLLPPQSKVETYGGGGNIAQYMSPLKLFEYMSFGKPIVASDLSVLREVLEHEKNALLVSPSNVEEWKGALKRLINKPELGKKISQQALLDQKEYYTWEKRARKIINFSLQENG